MHRCLLSYVLAALSLSVHAAPALERVETVPGAERERDGWSASTTCNLIYYNTCTGWAWSWQGWEPGSRLGVVFDHCCPVGGILTESWVDVKTAAPAGYGFTGTISVFDGDLDGCATVQRGPSQPYLPQSGWNQFAWGFPVASRFVIRVTHGPGLFNPIAYYSDHPAAGATGPPACGTCFPSSRAARSFDYGTQASPSCPGNPFDDGTCDAELLWDALVTCAGPTSASAGVEARSFGQVKALFR